MPSPGGGLLGPHGSFRRCSQRRRESASLEHLASRPLLSPSVDGGFAAFRSRPLGRPALPAVVTLGHWTAFASAFTPSGPMSSRNDAHPVMWSCRWGGSPVNGSAVNSGVSSGGTGRGSGIQPSGADTERRLYSHNQVLPQLLVLPHQLADLVEQGVLTLLD